MTRRIAIFVVVALAFAGVAAQADAQTLQGWDAVEYGLAQEYWGAQKPPDCEHVRIEYNVDGATMQPGVLGEATEPTERMRWCVVRVRAGLGQLIECAVSIHEFGHMMGNAHSTDPTNVMYPYIQPSSVPSACWCQWLEANPGSGMQQAETSFAWWMRQFQI